MLKILIYNIIICFSILSCSPAKYWNSGITNSPITYKINHPKTPLVDFKGNPLTIIYLENLAFEKTGENSNKEDIRWLLNQGYRVIELDYKYHPNATPTQINQDIIAINDAIEDGAFCGLTDCSNYQSYILFEGYRIARDVPYFKDDPSVYNTPEAYTEGDTLNMDIIYPANPKTTVPVVLSFSYSNSYATFDSKAGELTNTNQNKRTYLKYTFAGFNDSFLEGAPAHGMAWAIADHPKYCPWGEGQPKGGQPETYKSYQVNPDAAQKVKSAIRTLRKKGEALGLSGNIGIYGFSRGSTAGAMAIGDKSVPEFENAGFNQGISDDVQAAALGSGVFDYTQIYNVKDDGDKNLEMRCPWAWGNLESNRALWETMGASYLVESSRTAPTLFFYNTTDAPYYQYQIEHFKNKLDSLNVPTSTLIDYGEGHSVPQNYADLNVLYDFFKTHLK
ncbi:alpha/beta hydrolase family protein [Flavisericum labens]|uniref:alpha/beta hydrolase family protein n=1 Tax=Flavisericum labens TaxID=3377112 RepID=UPI00387AD9AB